MKTKTKSIKQFQKELEKKFPSIKIHGTIKTFYGIYGNQDACDGLWVSGETGSLFDYNNGNDPAIESYIKKAGYMIEWYDGGTVLLYTV